MYYKFPNEFFLEVGRRADLDIIEGTRSSYVNVKMEIEREIDEEYANGEW